MTKAAKIIDQVEGVYYAVRAFEAKRNRDLVFTEWGDLTDDEKEPFRAAVAFYQENPSALPSDAHAAWRLARMARGWVGGPYREEGLKSAPSPIGFIEQQLAYDAAMLASDELCKKLELDAAGRKESEIRAADQALKLIRDEDEVTEQDVAAHDKAVAVSEAAYEAEISFIQRLKPIRCSDHDFYRVHPACLPWDQIPQEWRWKYNAVYEAIASTPAAKKEI